MNIGKSKKTHVGIWVGVLLTSTMPAFTQATRQVPAEYATIQAAISASADGDLVLVSPGIYVEVIDFSGRAITVQSIAGPATTVIEKPFNAGNGVPGGQPSSPVVIFESGEGRNSVLDGFTITKGTGRFFSAWACDCDGYQLGGGLLILNSSPLVKNCIIRENNCFTYHSQGGGVYTSGGSPRFEHCQFLLNGAGGGYGRGGGAWIAGNAEFFNCDFRLNTGNSYHFGFGGGVWVEGGAPLFDSVRIVQNQASHGIGALRVTPTTRLHRVYVGGGQTAPMIDGTAVNLGGNVLDGDCDANGVPDHLEIASGKSRDLNGNGVPDHCDCLFGPTECCPADLNNDGVVNGADISVLLGYWGQSGKSVVADITGDGLVDGADLAMLLSSWGKCQ